VGRTTGPVFEKLGEKRNRGVTLGHSIRGKDPIPCGPPRGGPFRGAGIGVLLVLALGIQGAAEASSYTVDAARSAVSVHVGRAGLFGFAGHEHLVIAPRLEGEIDADPAHVESSSVRLTFESAALRVSARGEPPSDVPKVQARMLGPDVLDAARFPTVSLRSTRVEARQVERDTYDLEVTGTLTLHGVARPVVLPVRVVLSGGTLRARGRLVLRQSDYGMKPVSVGGLVKVKDEVSIDFTIVAVGAP
jgi:polyisoprenoid-binding protein YceI